MCAAPTRASAAPEPPAPAGVGPDLSLGDLAVHRVDTADGLEAFAPEWADLLARSTGVNPFYEPEAVMAGWRCFPAPGRPCCVFVFRTDGAGRREMIGAFPLRLRTRLRGIPLRHLAAWSHPQLFLATPAVDDRHGVDAFRGLVAWARRRGCHAIEWPLLTAGGSASSAFRRAVAAAGGRTVEVDRYERAFLTKAHGSFDSYMATAVSGAARRQWGKLRRGLARQGALETRVLGPGEDAGAWIEQLLRIEERGWKGREGSALLSDKAGAGFFRSLGPRLHARGRLLMIGLFLDGEPIALQSYFIAGRTAFAFKMAYEESHAKHSPGMLLQVDFLDHFFRSPEIEFADSCTSGPHVAMDRVWADRRPIEHVLASTGTGRGRLAVGAYPLLQTIKGRAMTLGARTASGKGSDAPSGGETGVGADG